MNYRLDDEEEMAEFKTEVMRELFPGVYQARGAIFPGETLQYYITVEGRGATFSDVERADERLTNGEKRFDILQDALASLKMEDNESFIELCEDYIIKDRIVKEIIWAE